MTARDDVDLAELLDVIEELMLATRYGTLYQTDYDAAAYRRAKQVLLRHRPAAEVM